MAVLGMQLQQRSSLGAAKQQGSGSKPARVAARAAVSRRPCVTVQAIAEAERTKKMAAGGASTPVEKDILAKLKYQFGKAKPADAADLYQGAALSVREHLIDAYDNTHAYWE